MPKPPRHRVDAKSRTPAPATEAQRTLLAYLRGILPSLKPTERRIAECVLADPDAVVASSIVEIRRRSGVSLGSVVSFCQRLGLRGFGEFKLSLARELALSSLPPVHKDASLFEKVQRVYSQNLAETFQINSLATFERLAEVLQKARRIEFFATGLSQPVAYTAYCKFRLIGLQASTQSDSHVQLINAAQLKPGDVGFGISCSGVTRETVQCIEVAKAEGATTVCLTNALHSPITERSDFCLYATPSEINYFQAPMASRVTQLAVMDTLFMSLAVRDRTRSGERVQGVVRELLKRRI